MLIRCCAEGIEGLIDTGKLLGDTLPYHTDPQGKEHSLEGHFLGFFYSCTYILCTAGAHTLEVLYLLGFELIEVGIVVYESCTEHQLYRLGTQALYIHRLAGDEVLDTPCDLWRAAIGIGAIVLCLALIAYQFTATLRTMGDKGHRSSLLVACFEPYSRNLRDDLSSLFDKYLIADMESELGYLVCIVQRSALYNSPRQEHRREIGYGGNSACTPYLIGDTLQRGSYLFGLELISYRPARRLGSVTEFLLCLIVIDLDHHPIGFIGEVMAAGIPIVDKLHHLVGGVA